LLKSTLRKSPIAANDYVRQGSEDDRFVDYIGAVQSIVTSAGQNDGGMFETNLRDERFFPFEGTGAESTWKLDLPKDYRLSITGPSLMSSCISDIPPVRASTLPK
jgi:receptor-binding and translocation channel-forming TcA subunit of Tc toxin